MEPLCNPEYDIDLQQQVFDLDSKSLYILMEFTKFQKL